MVMPDWLVKAANAQQFASPGGATLGDIAQGIGHDMLQHYRGLGGQQPAGPGAHSGMDIGQLAALLGQGTPMNPAMVNAPPAPGGMPGPRPPAPPTSPTPDGPMGAATNWGSLQPFMNPAGLFGSPLNSLIR